MVGGGEMLEAGVETGIETLGVTVVFGVLETLLMASLNSLLACPIDLANLGI